MLISSFCTQTVTDISMLFLGSAFLSFSFPWFHFRVALFGAGWYVWGKISQSRCPRGGTASKHWRKKWELANKALSPRVFSSCLKEVVHSANCSSDLGLQFLNCHEKLQLASAVFSHLLNKSPFVTNHPLKYEKHQRHFTCRFWINIYSLGHFPRKP